MLWLPDNPPPFTRKKKCATHLVLLVLLPFAHPHESAHALGAMFHSSIADESSLNRKDNSSARTWYHTVRPSFLASSMPARASANRCRATIEKSMEQHSAISVTEHRRPHLIKQASSLARVGSPIALKNSGSSSGSSLARLREACLGVAGERSADFFWIIGVMMPVYRTGSALSNACTKNLVDPT